MIRSYAVPKASVRKLPGWPDSADAAESMRGQWWVSSFADNRRQPGQVTLADPSRTCSIRMRCSKSRDKQPIDHQPATVTISSLWSCSLHRRARQRNVRPGCVGAGNKACRDIDGRTLTVNVRDQDSGVLRTLEVDRTGETTSLCVHNAPGRQVDELTASVGSTDFSLG